MKKPEITKYYVARNKNGSVFLYNKKPIKSKKQGFWKIDGRPSADNLMLLLKVLSVCQNKVMSYHIGKTTNPRWLRWLLSHTSQ